MIQTGPRIRELLADGSITIDPPAPTLIGPNSVDLRLHNQMRVYEQQWGGQSNAILDMKKPNYTRDLTIPHSGLILRPGHLYLARTVETIGSNKYVPMVEGRSSCGRLGLQVHMTAGFCDIGFKGTITLEMTVVYPLRVYPGVPVAQVFFLKPEGAIQLYEGRYQGHVDATASRMHVEREGAGR